MVDSNTTTYADKRNVATNNGAKIYGNGRMAMFQNVPSSTAQFYLSRVMPGTPNRSLMLSLFGTLLGAALGIALCEGITAANIRAPEIVRLMLLSDQWYLRWQPGSVVAGVLIVTFCSMLVSLIPSFLAARMKPVTAMHYIG